MNTLLIVLIVLVVLSLSWGGYRYRTNDGRWTYTDLSPILVLVVLVILLKVLGVL